MNRQIGVALTHFGTAAGGFIAAVAFMSSQSVDIYAAYNQLNVVIAEVTKLVAIVTPIATGAYAVYKASTKQQVAELVKDPAVLGVVTTEKLAESIPDNRVVANAADLPVGHG